MAKTASDFLRTAIDRLRNGEGWTRGAWRRKAWNAYEGKYEMRYCLLGALQVGKDMLPRWQGQADALDILAKTMEEQVPELIEGRNSIQPYTMMSWNDSRREPEDIIRVLEKAYVRSLEPTFDDDSDS